MEWSTEHERMEWWTHKLRPFHDYCVGSIVPFGFEAIGRLFHPIRLEYEKTETWADVAKRHGRVVHPEMQLHSIATPLGETPDYRTAPSCWVGDLPIAQTRLLSHVVARHTATPDNCWFGVWDGYGGMPLPRDIERAGSAGPRNRQHFLLRGTLAELDQSRGVVDGRTPNLWWPEDRSWFVASEIDFCWTLIGGSNALIDELVAAEDLEVLRSGYDHRGTVDADTINI